MPFRAKDGNTALLRLSESQHLVEYCDHTDQQKVYSSINQRMIYGHLRLGDAIMSPRVSLNETSSRYKTSSYPSHTLSDRHLITLSTITLPRK